MPTARKPTTTSRPFSTEQIAAAKAAANDVAIHEPAVDWSNAIVTPGGGVAKTIAAIRKARGPNKNPTKEQVAIRLDHDVLTAFRASGPGWQTRVNSALKEWLTSQPSKRKASRASGAKT